METEYVDYWAVDWMTYTGKFTQNWDTFTWELLDSNSNSHWKYDNIDLYILKTTVKDRFNRIMSVWIDEINNQVSKNNNDMLS